MRRGARKRRWGAIAAGGVLAVVPIAAPAAGARTGAGVRLVADFTAVPAPGKGPDYAMTYIALVRATGGTAHGTAVRLTADRPMSWTRHSEGCALSGQDVDCRLGDVGKSAVKRVAVVRVPASALTSKALNVSLVASANNASTRTVRTVINLSAAKPKAKPRAKPGGTRPGTHGKATHDDHSCAAEKPAQSEGVAPPAEPDPGGKPPVSSEPSASGETPTSHGGPATSHHKPSAGGTPRGNGIPAVGGKPESSVGGKPKVSSGTASSGKPSFKKPSSKGEPLETGPLEEDAAPSTHAAPGVAPQMSVAPRPPEAVVLPPVTAQQQQAPRPNGEQMTLVSPAATDDEGDGTDWALVLGIVLIAEIGLLWGAACVGLWRRRLLFRRTPDQSADA
ncbi:hypothetical protein [Actinomadura litoris]|uniref:DUF11 domain-containing protein n=1 Tax=Actinomadura litoris TaxID=2678616 RepID=A0A7K1L1F1_9ACTN|nr:hypothetical protein [Actinomadura litoris]MUN38133.1 hypothetical protein [Actinomadura litoris]